MSAGGKGHARRPTDEAAYSAGYDAIFSRKADQAWVDSQRAEYLSRANRASQTSQNCDKMNIERARD